METETDYAGSGSFPLTFSRTYNSIYAPYVSSMGGYWVTNFDRQVLPTSSSSQFLATRGDGKAYLYTLNGNLGVPDNDVGDQLIRLTDTGGSPIGWKYTTINDEVELYDISGKLQSITNRAGLSQTLTYGYSYKPDPIAPPTLLLMSVADSTGRQLAFTYDPLGRIATMTDPGGGVTQYAYTFGSSPNLISRTDPNLGVRTYVYNEQAYTANTNLPYALTGIVDENQARFATFKYNSAGQAVSTEHAGGVDHITLGYSGTTTTVTDALGAVRTYVSTTLFGVVKPAIITEPCPSCAGGTITHTNTYDANGYPDQTTDLNGTITDRDYNARGLETQRIEAKTVTGGSTPPEKRTITTAWNTNFRVPDQRSVTNVNGATEALTKWSYNTRGQPLSRCEIDPAVSGATSYTCGSATTAPAGVRQWLTTYCEQSDLTAGTCPLIGLVKSVNGPRATTDAGMGGLDDTTTYTYYQTDDSTCASGGACPHRHGDLWKVTNALSQVTTYVTYDKNGRVTRTLDANGTYTDFVYHVRGWLTDRIVRASATGAAGSGDATTHIDYDAVGNVTKVTQADSAYLAYTYDAAHRLIKITDNLSNTIDYCPGGVGSATCLDAAGNRKVEQVKDPSGTLKRSLSRVYNQLSQLTKLLNAANAPVERSDGLTDTGVADGYDGNGNRVLVKDGLTTTTRQTYDPLNRLVATIQNVGGTDPATANTTTGYTYDTRDNLRQVADPDGLNTVYTYDGLNNLTGLSSPDTGTTTYTPDKAGNRISQTDARGIASTYAYDALNRLTAIGYPTTALNIGYAYDQANATTGCATSYPVGRLTQMTDGSGNTTYCYDRRGNVIAKTQVTSTITLTTQYSYTLADRLASITYPSGAIVTYTRDTVGRVKTVTWKANATATATTVVSNATYYPFGPLNVLTYGNGRTLTKAYDQDYAIDTIASSVTTGLKLDLGVDVMGDVIRASGTINPATPDRAYAYDPLYRLTTAQTGAATPSPLEAYTYGKTGDRLSAALNGGTATSYTYTAGTHRLASVGGTARTYDPNGNTLTGIAGTFTYNDKNRLATFTQGTTVASYQTNGRGERVRKGVAIGGFGSSPLTYSYDEGGQLLSEYGGSIAQAEYVYLDNLPIAVAKGTTLAYVETDHLGTPRQVFDPATNSALWTWDFLASTFGTATPNPSPGGGAAYTLNLRFPGQYYDAETGLNYNYFRDYEPGTGRYVESDPIGLNGAINTYAYAIGSPLVYSDKNGDVAAAAAGVCFIPGVGWISCAAAAAGTAAIGVICYATGACQELMHKIVDMCVGQGDGGSGDRCDKKLSDELLKRLGINAHAIKADALGTNKNLSLFDLCGCSDGRIVVKRYGCKGDDEPQLTGWTWK